MNIPPALKGILQWHTNRKSF